MTPSPQPAIAKGVGVDIRILSGLPRTPALVLKARWMCGACCRFIL
jgi:hypothetical protein